MNKLKVIFMALLLAAAGQHASGQDVTKIYVQGPFEVTIRQGDSCTVSYEAPAEVRNRLIVIVDGNTLHIRNKHDNWSAGDKSWWSSKGWWHTHPKIKLLVSVHHLETIKVSGSSNVSFIDGVISKSLTLITHGSAVIEGGIHVQTLKVSVSGSGLIRLSGQCDYAEMRISGSGVIDGKALSAVRVHKRISGSGHADVHSGLGDTGYAQLCIKTFLKR